MRIEDCPRPTYDNLEGFSQSQAKVLLRDPRLYWESYIAGNLVFRDSPWMQFGRDVESWLMHDAMEGEISLIPDEVLSKAGTRAGKAYKEWLSTQPSTARLMKNEEYLALAEKLNQISISVEGHPKALELLESGTKDVAYQWTCPSSLLTCKGLVDVGALTWNADIKVTRPRGFDDWERVVVDFGYHIQASHYTSGHQAEFDMVPEFYHIVIETEEPFRVEVYQFDEAFLEIGDMQMAKAKRQFDQYSAWPDGLPWVHQAYGQARVLSPPHWLMQRETLELDWDE